MLRESIQWMILAAVLPLALATSRVDAQVVLRDPLENATGSNLRILSTGDTISGTGADDPDITIGFGIDYATLPVGNPAAVTGAPFPAGIPEAPHTQPGDMPRRGLFMSANDDLLTNITGLSDIVALVVDPNDSEQLLTVTGDYEVQVDVWMNYDKGSANATEFGGLLVAHDGTVPGRLSGGGFLYSGDSGAAQDFRLHKAPVSGTGNPDANYLGFQEITGEVTKEDPNVLINGDGQYNPEIAIRYFADPQFDDAFGVAASLDNENDFFQETFTDRLDLGASFSPNNSQGSSQAGPSGVVNPPGDMGFRWGTIRIEVFADQIGTGSREAAGIANVYLSATWEDDEDGDLETEDPITVESDELFIGTLDNSIDAADRADNAPSVLDFSNAIGLLYGDLFASFEESGFNFGVFDNLIVTQLSAGLAGDYNEDGHVNAADYVVFRNNQNTDFTLPNENPAATTPGFVDQEDYEFWVTNFGNALGSGAAAAANVPEPTTSAIAHLVVLFLAVRRRAKSPATRGVSQAFINEQQANLRTC